LSSFSELCQKQKRARKRGKFGGKGKRGGEGYGAYATNLETSGGQPCADTLQKEEVGEPQGGAKGGEEKKTESDLEAAVLRIKNRIKLPGAEDYKGGQGGCQGGKR